MWSTVQFQLSRSRLFIAAIVAISLLVLDAILVVLPAFYPPVFDAAADRPFDTVLPATFIHDILIKGSPKLCLVDANLDYDEYKRGHIPSALFFNQSFRIFNASAGTFLAAVDVRKIMQDIGIEENCRIVTYDLGQGSNGQLNASLVWWIFKVQGHKSVSVLEGGLKSWTDRHYDLETEDNDNFTHKNIFYPSLNQRFYVDFERLKLYMSDNATVLLDVRPLEQFEGRKSSGESILYRGHVPNALNLPIDQLLTINRTFPSTLETDVIMQSLGLSKTQPIILYSNAARMASGAFIILDRAGYNVQIFPGGWMEYTNKVPQNQTTTIAYS